MVLEKENNKTESQQTDLVNKNQTNEEAPQINKTQSHQENLVPDNATKQIDYKAQIDQIKLQINNGEIESAQAALEILYKNPEIPLNYREEIFALMIDLYFQIYNDKLKDNYLKISNLINEALYIFPNSLYVPTWLLKLCYLNIQVGNLDEAKAYFSILKEKYPKSSFVAQVHYYFGTYYFKNNDLVKAREQFETIVENYQTSPVVKDAAVNLTRVLYKMELYDLSWQVMKYMQQRWPLFYQKAPDILKLAGYVSLINKKYNLALDYYWQYYNILPEVKDADTVLTRIGDLYLKKGEVNYAKKMYEYVAQKYPDKEGGLIAKMRLAEEGIYDEPTIKDMFSVFDRPFNLRPEKIYKEIIEKHPDSPLAPLAYLKLSIWYLWRNNYLKSLDVLSDFYKKYPDSQLIEDAKKTGIVALTRLINKAIKDNMYTLILSTWNKYAFLTEDLSKLDPSVVMAVAIAYWKTGNPAKALELAKPYLDNKDKKISLISSLELILNIYLESEEWLEIEKLGKSFLANSELPEHLRSQLKYAYSLAKVNLGKGEEVINILKGLAIDNNLSEKQRGYVFYFLATEEYKLKNLENAYIYAQEALSIFLKQNEKNPRIKDCLRILIDVTKVSGRIMEAIEWAEKFNREIGDDSKEKSKMEYELAKLYKDAGYIDIWQKKLREIEKKYPDTIYGELAKNELTSLKLRQKAMEYMK